MELKSLPKEGTKKGPQPTVPWWWGIVAVAVFVVLTMGIGLLCRF